MLYFSRIFRESSKLLLSGTVGPEAIASRSSPITSESMGVTSVAGYAARASFPPFIPEICFLIVLISCMLAPHFSNSCVVACLSAKVIPATGSGMSADPPPDMRQKTISFSPHFPRRFNIFSVPFIPASSGTGWAASFIDTLFMERP